MIILLPTARLLLNRSIFLSQRPMSTHRPPSSPPVACAAPPIPTPTPSSPPRLRTLRPPDAAPTFKRKLALYIAYDGSSYAGLQKNVGVTTVSSVLEDALFAAGHIEAWNYGDVKKISWAAAARTDKGVSAASNVVAMKLVFPRDTSTADAAAQTRIDYPAVAAAINAHLPSSVRVLGVARPTASFKPKAACSGREYEYLLPRAALSPTTTLQAFAQILARFQGTHSFHNYTVGPEHSLPPPARASRYITLATCSGEPFVLAGAAFVRVRISGQSFQLHQIRKMVAAALLVDSAVMPPDAIERSFDTTLLTNIPPAPAEGLFLNTLHFHGYNKRFQDKLEQPIEVDSFEEEREAFKEQFVYPSIVKRFEEDDGLGIFFRTVDDHKPTFE